MNILTDDLILSEIEPLRRKLMEHPVYEALQSIKDLRLFMEHHVFAVWDFMSLLKTLQRSLTCVAVPWFPHGNTKMRRLINQIVSDEESDSTIDGRPVSHFELYLEAMSEANASTEIINRFIGALQEGSHWEDALKIAAVPEYVSHFVKRTFVILAQNKIHMTAAAFTYGREDLIPDIFSEIVAQLNREYPGQLETFHYYLERHIELDGDEHGKMGREMVAMLCDDSESKWCEAIIAARKSLEQRILLWDGIYRSLESVRV